MIDKHKKARSDRLLKYISKENYGIEVAPYFNPIASKSDGYNVMILDVFDTKTLIEKAKKDSNIIDEGISEIETVDIVGNANNIEELVSEMELIQPVEYIVSSHNFEHLPNPVKFLRGCGNILVEGGTLSMAIPDCRACFDHFRSPTRLSDWLSAYFQNVDKPTPTQIFDGRVVSSLYCLSGKKPKTGCNLNKSDPLAFVPKESLINDFKQFRDSPPQQTRYIDTHCSAVFGKVFELLVGDLHFLELIDLELVEVTPTFGTEFFVHFRKGKNIRLTQDEFYKNRSRLLKGINAELGYAAFPAWTNGNR